MFTICHYISWDYQIKRLNKQYQFSGNMGFVVCREIWWCYTTYMVIPFHIQIDYFVFSLLHYHSTLILPSHASSFNNIQLLMMFVYVYITLIYTHAWMRDRYTCFGAFLCSLYICLTHLSTLVVPDGNVQFHLGATGQNKGCLFARPILYMQCPLVF